MSQIEELFRQTDKKVEIVASYLNAIASVPHALLIIKELNLLSDELLFDLISNCLISKEDILSFSKKSGALSDQQILEIQKYQNEIFNKNLDIPKESTSTDKDELNTSNSESNVEPLSLAALESLKELGVATPEQIKEIERHTTSGSPEEGPRITPIVPAGLGEENIESVDNIFIERFDLSAFEELASLCQSTEDLIENLSGFIHDWREILGAAKLSDLPVVEKLVMKFYETVSSIKKESRSDFFFPTIGDSMKIIFDMRNSIASGMTEKEYYQNKKSEINDMFRSLVKLKVSL